MHKLNFSGSFVHRVPSITSGESSIKKEESSLLRLIIFLVKNSYLRFTSERTRWNFCGSMRHPVIELARESFTIISRALLFAKWRGFWIAVLRVTSSLRSKLSDKNLQDSDSTCIAVSHRDNTFLHTLVSVCHNFASDNLLQRHSCECSATIHSTNSIFHQLASAESRPERIRLCSTSLLLLSRRMTDWVFYRLFLEQLVFRW